MVSAFKKFSVLLVVVILTGIQSLAQRASADDAPVTFEELYDAPYDINQLFVGFQPIYGETFVSNMNGGFGLEASYFHQDIMRIHAGARMAYGRTFDQERSRAERNSTYVVDFYKNDPTYTDPNKDRKGVTNSINGYQYFEVGGTYHIKDFEKDSETKMYLYRKSYLGDKWASRVPKVAPIPCKVRQIYGARIGSMFYKTATDLRRAMDKQGVQLNELVSETGANFVDNHVNPGATTDDISLSGNMTVFGVFAGASMTWIHNVAVEFDNKYEAGVDDLILSAYLDFIYGASIIMDDITYLDSNGPDGNTRTYALDPIKVNPVGFRLGLEGKFNRTLSWSYGGEIGYKPALKGRGFFALIKISVPVYSTTLKYEVEAFGK